MGSTAISGIDEGLSHYDPGFLGGSYTSKDPPWIYATVPYMATDKDLLWIEGFGGEEFWKN